MYSRPDKPHNILYNHNAYILKNKQIIAEKLKRTKKHGKKFELTTTKTTFFNEITDNEIKDLVGQRRLLRNQVSMVAFVIVFINVGETFCVL